MKLRYKQFRLVLFIVLPVAILVLIRTLIPDHFKLNARKLAETSFTNANTMTREQVATLESKPLIIKISSEAALQKNLSTDTLYIPMEQLLEKEHLKSIRANQGPVILFSSDPAVSAKAWMILTQMGYNNLFILTNDRDNEVLKYKFRPDTSKAGI